MATQGEGDQRTLAVRVNPPRPQQNREVLGSTLTVGPFVPAQFSVIAYHRRSGTWRYINDFIVSMTWDDSTDMACMTANLQLSNQLSENGRIGSWLSAGTDVRLLFAMDGHINPNSAKWIELARFLVWSVRRKNSAAGGAMAEVTLFDQMQHLKSSYDTFMYYSGNKPKNVSWNAHQITVDICKRFNIPVGSIPKFEKMAPIPYIYKENISIYDFLLTIWTMERDFSKNRRRFILRFRRGKLYIIRRTARSRMWELRGSQNNVGNWGGLTDSEYNFEIDPGDSEEGTATSVTVRGMDKDAEGEETRIAVISRTVTNDNLMRRLGRLHKIITSDEVKNRDDADKKAEKFLRDHGKLKQEGSLSVLGIPFLRAGDPVYVVDPETSLKGKFFTTSVSQSIDAAGNYSMQVGINLKDSVPRLEVDPEELKAVPAVETSSTESDGATKTAKMPQPVFEALVAALEATGLPVAWASSNAMTELIQHESGFSSGADNPTSTAYGLFQFLSTTWASVDGHAQAGPKLRQALGPMGPYDQSDMFVQCVYGVLYVWYRYKTPENAWNFWQAQSPHWY